MTKQNNPDDRPEPERKHNRRKVLPLSLRPNKNKYPLLFGRTLDDMTEQDYNDD